MYDSWFKYILDSITGRSYHGFLFALNRPMSVHAGSPAFKRINRAMVFGGFSTFALLYCVQPLMPLMASEFSLTPAESSLSLSASTAALALSLVFSSILSDRVGRKPMMVTAMLGGALCTIACAFAHNFPQLLVLRALLGVALGGMPAVAMAYLGEEIEPTSLGLSMGLYIGGSAFGGMLGRVLTSVISDYFSWRYALAGMGTAALYAAWEFRRSLPASQNFRQGRRGMTALAAGFRQHLSDPGLPWLFVPGVGLFTFGFFASHSVASSWVGRRAREPKALASAIYLLFYYLGSSVLGSCTGAAWSAGGWPGVVGLLGAVLAISFMIALRLRSLAPLGTDSPVASAAAVAS